MKIKHQEQQIWPINQLLIFLVALLAIFLILKSATEIIVPFLIAVTIAILLSPIFSYLETKHIPKAVSLIFITLLVLIPVILLGGYVGQEVQDFAKNYDTIQQGFDEWFKKFSLFLATIGIEVSLGELKAVVGKTNFTELIQNLAVQAKDQFSDIFLIFFIVAFILMESTYLYNKLVKIMRKKDGNIGKEMVIIDKVQSYFLIKMKTSMLTAMWVMIVLWYFDIEYFLLWATLAFFFNFIPVVGSILAAIPAILMALVTQDPMTTVWVTLWYVIINMVVGNILEPKIMGKGLGLSALVIFLSMTFWGWVFGPAGMILSVPLTMGMQFLFDQYEETKWVAFLLSDYEEEK